VTWIEALPTVPVARAFGECLKEVEPWRHSTQRGNIWPR
jgi:hypothetical protein